MGSSGRLLGSLQAPQAHLSKSLFVCSTCRQQFRPQTLRAATSYRNASGSTSFTEKVRRKIWGTDNPPGLKDPYGGEGFVEKALRQRRGEGEVEVEPEPQREREQVETTPPEEYVPATTWAGLETVGTLGEWWDKPRSEADHYKRFMAVEKVVGRNQITAALNQVMVELCLLRELELPLSTISEIQPYTSEERMIFGQVKIEPSADNSTATLSFPDAQSRETLVAALQSSQVVEEEVTTETQEMLDSENAPNGAEEVSAQSQEIIDNENVAEKAETTPLAPPKDTGFVSLSLNDPQTKFAVLKRTSQITGHRIPDNHISSLKTVSQLINQLVSASKPKPKKLAESLAADKQLQSLPNVKIAGRRMTPIDKEKEVGRWKVIEEELNRRGLPVTGNLPSGAPRHATQQ
ncbi:hypothetical protein FQN54_008913 [Arachnomyces sp. PD_36]|nr:hypothetical protein FQN54_008913 [Arachnomyces sp. PD_36]